jgi:hypothetical protein
MAALASLDAGRRGRGAAVRLLAHQETMAGPASDPAAQWQLTPTHCAGLPLWRARLPPPSVTPGTASIPRSWLK